MKTSLLSVALLSALAFGACAKTDPAPAPMAAASADMTAGAAAAAPMADAPAPPNPMVGGAPMLAERDIVDNAANSSEHTTLVAAIKAAGLVETLKGAGPFTVFAPTDAAFGALPAGTVEGLLQPDKKADLASVLTYHVVAGKVDAAALVAQIQAGGGSATLTTVQGGQLVARADGGTVTITDAQGNAATVTTADVRQSNGVVHVVDKVLLP